MIRHFLCVLIFTGLSAFSVSGNNCNCAIPDTALRMSITWSNWSGSEWRCEDKYTYVYGDKDRTVQEWYGCDNDISMNHTIYEYGNSGLIKTTYFKESDTEFLASIRSTTYEYPRLDTVLTESNSNNGWVNSKLEVIADYHSPSNGLPGEKTGYIWKNSAWVPQADTLYEYNSFDSLINYTVMKWNASSTKFTPEFQMINSFNSSGFKTEYVYKVADGNNLVNSYKETYTYDSKNRITEKDYFDWDKSNSSWKQNGRDINTYSSGSGFELITREHQNLSGNAWETSGKTIDSLVNGQLLASIIYHNDNNQWTLSERYVFAYDCFGNQVSSTEQYYTGSDWENLYHTQIAYLYRFSTSSHRSLLALTKNVPVVNSKRGMITIENIPGGKDVAAEIFDLRGRMVTSIKAQALQNKITINTNNVLTVNSPYIIRLKDQVGNVVWKGKLPLVW